MDGEIIAFDDVTQEGVIDATDGEHYAFGLNDWRGRGLPERGLAVRFDARQGGAVQVMNRPETQRRARGSMALPSASRPGERHGQRYPPVPIAALIIAVPTAIAGLWLGVLAMVLAVVATGLGGFALHHLRRNVTNTRGRLLGWIALGIATLAATLSLLIKPPFGSPLLPELQSQSQVIVMPGISRTG